MNASRLTRLGLLLAMTFALLLGAAAAAAAAPVWRINSLANTTVAPSGTITYYVIVTNVGDTPAPPTTGGDANNCVPGSPAPSDPSKCIVVRGNFPAGLTPLQASTIGGAACSVQASTIACPYSGADASSQFAEVGNSAVRTIIVTAQVKPGVTGTLTSSFEVSGGEASSAGTTVDPTLVSAAPLPFGIDQFDTQAAADAAGDPLTQAGGHPYDYSTAITFNTVHDASPLSGDLHPVASTRDITVDLPAGFIGDPTVADRCTADQLANGGMLPLSLCPPSSQVGTVLVSLSNAGTGGVLGPLPVFNLVPPPNAPARLGFNVSGTIVTLDATLQPSDQPGGYRLRAKVSDVTELGVQGTQLTLWGVPSDPAHDRERACAGVDVPAGSGISCPSEAPREAFLRNPTSCTPSGAGLPTTLSVDAWENPGVQVDKTIYSHDLPGFPAAESEWGPQQGTTGCGQLPFTPTFSGGPEAGASAGAPAAFGFDLKLPQSEDPSALAEADVKKAVVTLPTGVRVSPSSADGLQGCSSVQIALDSESAPSCPDGSKLGMVTIDTPLLAQPLSGSIYLATPFDNPFKSLLAIYLVASGEGVTVKLPGQVQMDPATGQITTTVDDSPQTPFTDVHLQFNGGPRAALTPPDGCGTYATHASLTSWSGAAVDSDSTFTVDQGCGAHAFSPILHAGTQNPLAGATSPFALQLKRSDAEPELSSLAVALPPGLSGYLKGISYCPDATLAAISGEEGTGRAQEANPSCPAASQIGTVTVGAGPGSNPFYTSSGRAYLAGPYKNAPLSIAVVTPAVAGPFDLGSVVVRNALRIDPETAQITALSDPLPTILHGIPLDLRDVRVSLNRPDFTLNPTNCEPLSIASTVTGTGGASASPSVHFQVAGCERLGFKPKLAVRLIGSTKRSGNPALRATLTARHGDANLARVAVAFPHAEFLAQSHIRTICTRVQFAAGAGNGAACPAGSIYGKVTATSPIIDYTLTGNVYLRSSSHPLPDLVLALHGPPSQPIAIDAVGRIDSHHGGIRNTFDSTPDAPLTKVVLTMSGGSKGLLENSTDLCRRAHRVTTVLTAQNGKSEISTPAMKVKCPNAHKGKHKRHR